MKQAPYLHAQLGDLLTAVLLVSLMVSMHIVFSFGTSMAASTTEAILSLVILCLGFYPRQVDAPLSR